VIFFTTKAQRYLFCFDRKDDKELNYLLQLLYLNNVSFFFFTADLQIFIVIELCKSNFNVVDYCFAILGYNGTKAINYIVGLFILTRELSIIKFCLTKNRNPFIY
jgi:hypothetical protein